MEDVGQEIACVSSLALTQSSLHDPVLRELCTQMTLVSSDRAVQTGNITLNEQQATLVRAFTRMSATDKLRLVSKYRVVFCEGRAGTGKTTAIQHVLSKAGGRKRAVFAVTTNIALSVIRTDCVRVTLASLFCVGAGLRDMSGRRIALGSAAVKLTLYKWKALANTPKERLEKMTLSRRDIRRAVCILSSAIADPLLVVDEFSMLSAEFVDFMNLVLQAWRSNHAQPFGGVRVLFTGDPMQMPPVSTAESVQKPLTEASIIQKTKHIAYHRLTASMRARSDPRLQTLVSDLSNGIITAESCDTLRLISKQWPPDPVRPRVSIHCARVKVAAANELWIRKTLPQNRWLFKTCVEWPCGNNTNLQSQLHASHVVLAVGQRVTLVTNLYLRFGTLVSSGSTGQITGFGVHAATSVPYASVIFTLDNGKQLERPIYPIVEETVGIDINRPNTDAVCLLRQTFMPLEPANAITVYAAQGQTITDLVEVDPTQMTQPGALYTAISRVRTIADLVIDPRKLIIGEVAAGGRTVDDQYTVEGMRSTVGSIGSVASYHALLNRAISLNSLVN